MPCNRGQSLRLLLESSGLMASPYSSGSTSSRFASKGSADPCCPQVERVGRSEGFTIIEGVVSTFLLTVAVVSVANLIMFSINQGSSSSRAASATILAQQELEGLHDLSYDDVISSTRSATVGSDSFVITRTVITNGLPSNMKRIHVQVSWGYGKSYDVETILSSDGL